MEIISRANARAAGLATYFTSKQCPRGHVSARYTSNAVCVACNAENVRSEEFKREQKSRRRTPESREASRLKSKRYHQENREQVLAKMRERNKRYYEANKDRIKVSVLAYQRANGDARNTYKAKWSSERAKIDPEFAMLLVMRKFVARMMERIASKRQQSERTTEILGYTPAEFVAHMEPLFKPGMTWNNHGEWHVDHIRPLSTFDLTNPEQRRLANSLQNLQPLWADENLKKSDRWPGNQVEHRAENGTHPEATPLCRRIPY